MKCKRCGGPIQLDGTQLADEQPAPSSDFARPAKKRTRSAPRRPPTASGVSTRWRVSEPSGKEHEMSLVDVAQTYSEGGFEPGTLVCAPGRDVWLPPYDHPQVMDMALPADEPDAPRSSQSTFGTRESEAPTKAAAKGSQLVDFRADANNFFGNNDVADAMDAFDNILSGPSSAGAPGTAQFPGTTRNVRSSPTSIPLPRGSAAKAAPANPTRPTGARPARVSGDSSDDPSGAIGSPGSRRRSVPPPSTQRPSSASPSRSAAVPAPRASTSRSAVPPSSSRPPVPSFRPPAPPSSSRPPALPPSFRPASAGQNPSTVPPVPQKTSSFPAPSFSPPAYPAPPFSAPPSSAAPVYHSPTSASALPSYRPRSAPPQSQSAPAYSPAPNSQSFPLSPPSFPPNPPNFAPSPPNIPQHPPSFAPGAAVPASAPPSPSVRSGPFHSGALSEPTFGTLTFPPQRQSTSRLRPLFLAIVLVLGALAGIYLFRPALFQRGMSRIQSLLGIQTEAVSTKKVEGPPFDAQAAGEVLGQMASQAGKCREPGGPVGKGRAQVLYSTDGAATSVAVSRPFHETSVGSCLQEMFKKTRVPAFGGDPVVVSKTFDVE